MQRERQCRGSDAGESRPSPGRGRGGGYWEQANLPPASAPGLLLGRMTPSTGEQPSLQSSSSSRRDTAGSANGHWRMVRKGGERHGAGKAGTTMTLELKGALSPLGSLLLGCLRGQGACVQKDCFDHNTEMSQLNMALGLCGTALREVITDAWSFVCVSPVIYMVSSISELVPISVGLLPTANEASFFLIYFRKQKKHLSFAL